MEFEQPPFVTLANSFAEMSLFVDPSLNILKAYGPVYKFIGRDGSEVEGQELLSLFTSDSAKQLSILMNPLRARVQKAVNEDATENEIDSDGLQLRNLLLLRSGDPLLVEMKMTPRRDTVIGGGAYYYMVVLNDLSYTKDLEKKKNSFFATMNHELRTPLNGIIGLTESLRGGEKDKGRKKHFDIMLNSAQCMLKLINSILDTAAMKNHAADMELSQVRISNLAEEVVELMKTAVDKRGRKLKKDTVELSLEMEEDLPAIDLDKAKVFDAVEALVNNALKFTQKGHVIVRTSRHEESHGVLLSVEDTGIGIAPDAIERIFESFEQEDDDHENRKFEGIGLGLTLAKEVAALHGGKLWVESVVGEGSKFFMALPPNVRALKLISEKQRAANAASSAAAAGSGDGSGISQEEKDRIELIKVKQAEQIDIMQREVFAAMKAISHLTVDLELFEEKFKLYNQDPRTLGGRRPVGMTEAGAAGNQLSVASHFLSNKLRSYEMPTATGRTSTPSSRLHRNFGVGTNFAYNNYN